MHNEDGPLQANPVSLAMIILLNEALPWAMHGKIFQTRPLSVLNVVCLQINAGQDMVLLSLLFATLLLPGTRTQDQEPRCLQCFTLVRPPGWVHAKCKFYNSQTPNCSSDQFLLQKLENASFL